MIKRTILFLLFLVLILFAATSPQYSVASATSNQSSSNEITSITILAGISNNNLDANGKQVLKSNIQQGKNVVTLDSSQNGRTAQLSIGTLIFLHFTNGTYTYTVTPSKGIVETPKGTYNLPKDNIGLLEVVGIGNVTITIKKIHGVPGGTINAASTTTNWSGYARTSGGPFSDITSNWTVPTATSCSGGDTYSSAWLGIDGATNSNLIQTGTESDCISGTATYKVWWEILPSAATYITNTVQAGDQMFAEIKKNSTTWAITLKDLTQNWTFTTNQTYSGQQASSEWILEAPTVNGSTATLTNYGSTSFLNDSQNGSNPNHTYSTDSIDMVNSGSNVISATSQPNSNKSGFAVAYGATAPSAPSAGWTNEGNMSWGTYAQLGLLLPDGKVFAAGGVLNSSSTSTNHTELYTDGSGGTGSWASSANMNNDRKYFILQPVTISGGGFRVLSAGGVSDACSCVRNAAELYNESSNSWTNTPNMNAARYYHGSSVLSDGRVLVTGGDSNIALTGTLASTEIYDPSTNTWSAGPSLNYARSGFQAVLLHDGRIFVVGGGTTASSTHFEVYDPSTNTWAAYPTLVNNNWLSQAVVLGSGANYKVLIAGGGSSVGTKNAILFDPSNNSFSTTTYMNTARAGGFNLILLSNGNVLAVSPGYNGASSYGSEEYTP